MFLLRLHIFFAGLLCLMAGPATAQSGIDEDYFPLIEEYVNKIVNIYDGGWSYTYSMDNRLSGEKYTMRINRSLPFMERETLLSVDGMPPTEARVAEHRRERERELRRLQGRRDNRSGLRADEDEEDDEAKRFLKMINRDSIHLIRQEGDLLYLGFTAMEERRRRIFEHLDGILIMDTAREFIRELQVRTTGPFSPLFLAFVESGYLSLRFALQDDVSMQSGMTWRLNGQAFFVRDLDADMEVVWSNIQPFD